jgi:septal ring factor EnvC (AmiA/AmiB activator)
MTGVGYAQGNQGQKSDGPVTLKNRFNDIYSNSESYNEYKVIKNTRLRGFWKIVEDSLDFYRSKINEKAAMIQTQIDQNKSLEAKIKDLETSLEESRYNTDRINFMGVTMKKTLYNWIVWLLIAGLTAAAIYAMSGYIYLKRASHARKKEFKELVEEFEDYRKKSYETKIKMGRELQDERNLVEELKLQISARNSRKAVKP